MMASNSNHNHNHNPASLYPVVQDLTEVDSIGCCCMGPDGALSIGTFNLRDSVGSAAPLRRAARTTTASSSTAVSASSSNNNDLGVGEGEEGAAEGLFRRRFSLGGEQQQQPQQPQPDDGPLALRQSRSEGSAAEARKKNKKKNNQHHHHRRGFSLTLRRSDPPAGAAPAEQPPHHPHRHPASDSLLDVDTSSYGSEALAEAIQRLGCCSGDSSGNSSGAGGAASDPSSSASPTSTSPPGVTMPTFDEQYVLTRMVFRCENSQVWETVHRQSGQRYCVKILENVAAGGGGDSVAGEAHRLAAAQGGCYNSVVQLVHTVYERDAVYMVMEYVPGGNLLSRVVQQEGLSEDEAMHVMRSVLQGARHLHSRGICHLDLQPSNILLQSAAAAAATDAGNCKICDFGAAIVMNTTPAMNGVQQQPATDPYGSGGSNPSFSAYTAPEILHGGRQSGSPASDMWSIGVIMHFCLFGCLPPLLEINKRRPSSSHHTSSVPLISNARPVSRAAKQLLSGLLHVDPTVRFTAREALEHAWIQSLYYEVVYTKSDRRNKQLQSQQPYQKENNLMALSSQPTTTSGSFGPSGQQRRPFLRYLPTFHAKKNKKKKKQTKDSSRMSFSSVDCSTTEATTTTTETLLNDE